MANSPHPEMELISRSNFAFSNSLHEQLRINGEGGNLVFSPFSLGLVLLMARFGARRGTAEQLDQTLNPSKNAAKKFEDLRSMRRGFFRVLKSLEDDRSGDYHVTLANRMFTGTGFNVSEEFKKISKATLHVKVKQLNFTEDGGKPAADAINSWVGNKTGGKINGIISSDSITNQTQVLLVNTIHFKAPWKIPFDRKDTRNEVFHLSWYKDTRVAMMTSEDSYSYGDLLGMRAHAVVIPYKGNRLSMYVYVPKIITGLENFLQALKGKSMQQIREKIRAPENCEKVRLSLPKFKIQSDPKLMQPLKEMGARDMFSADRANFTGISEDANVYVSDVVQKVVITVDEAGTEAAAASSIRAGLTCKPTVTRVTADRPFYFQIVDEKTNVVLFAGTVRDPSTTVVEVDSSPAVPVLDVTGGRIREPTATPALGAPSVTPPGLVLRAPSVTPPGPALRAPSITPPARVETTATERSSSDTPPQVVFATSEGDIKTYSAKAPNLKTIVQGKTPRVTPTGLTWDSLNNLVYYSGSSTIYQVSVDGTGGKRAATISAEYGRIAGLDFDFITSNLYVATTSGYVMACKSTLQGSLRCFVVVSGQVGIYGIALNPNQGAMYLTQYSQSKGGRILMTDMDGTSPVQIVDGVGYPEGIAIDPSTSRILCADYSGNRIVSTNLAGGDIQTIGTESKPRGVAGYNGKVFWGNPTAKKLLSGTISGGNAVSVDVQSSISHLIVVTGNAPKVSRPNHCKGQSCAGICVLSAESFRCVA